MALDVYVGLDVAQETQSTKISNQENLRQERRRAYQAFGRPIYVDGRLESAWAQGTNRRWGRATAMEGINGVLAPSTTNGVEFTGEHANGTSTKG